VNRKAGKPLVKVIAGERPEDGQVRGWRGIFCRASSPLPDDFDRMENGE